MSSNMQSYLDPNGNPRLRTSIVGFLDLLGFSQSIQATTDPREAQLLVDRILAAINDSRLYVRQSAADDLALPTTGWALKFFSDNLVVGCPFDEDEKAAATAAAWFALRCAQRYQLRMALNGFFLRGALTQGPICMTDDIIFGAALLECYQLETKASIVPRVILAQPLVDLIAQSFHEGGDGAKSRYSSLCRDIDGWWFVSYLEAANDGGRIDWDCVERHKQGILQSLAGITRHDVLPKFGWACRYHNMFCHWHRNAVGYADRFRIERADETSSIVRLGESFEMRAHA